MPARPPETEFYEDEKVHELYRDVSRLYEDWNDWEDYSSKDRQLRFITVLQDVINQLRAASIEEVLAET